ncbi:hypothetical protein BHM03_00002432 [Ensete ventricosum]|nr:hypothetical protein BHM03_00002432 [Ensete ventricosum]
MRSDTSQRSMRSTERDEAEEAPPQEPSSSPSPRRARAGPSSQDDEARVDTASEARLSESLGFRRYHPPPPPAPPRGGLQDRHRRRRWSPPSTRRRGGSPVFHSRHQRFHERPGSGSFPRRQGLDGQHDPDAYSSMRQRIDRNSQGGRAEGRSAYGGPVSEGGYIHGNDPNLSLQEGDSVYHDPYCGNLNFARRTHCNNNNKHRYGPELSAPNHTSWRAFCHGSPSRTLDGIGHVLSHDSDRYGSLPPHGWGVVEDSRMPPPGCGAKFAGFKRRKREDYHDELEYRKGHQLHRPAAPEWDERDGDRDTQRRSMSSRGRWISRGRRCSPLVDRSLRGSFLGHGRDTVQRRGYRQFESQRKRRRSQH